MDEKIVFAAIKNTIIEQNKEFLLDLSKRFKLDYDYLCQKYIRPEYYLPILSRASATPATADGSGGSCSKDG